MGKKSKLAALAVGASLLLGTFGLTACVPENDDKTGNKVPEDIYAIYTAYAETAGEDAMTYDEWYAHLLETAKGDKGDDGKSAYDIWKENGHSGTEAEFLEWLKGGKGDDGKSAYEVWLEQEGNAGKSEEDFFASLKGDDGVSPEIKDGYWWIGDTNTNVKAEGINGVTPEIKDGYWWIGDTNTNVKAEGTNGARGNKITHSEGAPTSTEGAIEGDMYVDTKEWNVYFFEDNEWKPYGSIKGADGKDGGGTAEESPIKISIGSSGYAEIDIPAGTAQGIHIIEADLGATKLSTGRLQMHISGKSDMSELVYSESRSQSQHNVYFSYINIADVGSKITFQTTNGVTVDADITIKDYEMPTLKADGQPVEVPVNFNSASSMDLAVFKFKVDLASVVASGYTYTWSTTVASEVQDNLKLWFGGAKGVTFSTSKFSGGTLNIKQADHLDGCNGEAFFQIVDPTAKYNFIYPVTITLTKSS